MSRRIDIELTSKREDGTWTWRAPGARQPRGSLDGRLLPDAAKVGDVLRADADFDIDGIVVTSVLPPKSDPRVERVARIEVVGSGRAASGGGVSVMLAPNSRRRTADDMRGARSRRGAADRGRDDSREGTEGAARKGRDRSSASGRAPRTGRADGEGRHERPEGSTRDHRPDRSSRAERSPRVERGERGERPTRGERPERGERARRSSVVSTHRNAALAELRPEQLPVAEQLLRGGLPAVRHALDEQNARARSEGRAEVSPEPLLAMAEELLPRMNMAAWKDRAVAARNAGNDAALREVRSIVAAASTLSLDEEGREMARALREALQTRVTALRDGWLGRITTALDEGRVGDALRISARPPEPAARVPAELAVRLADAAGQAMAPDVADAEWAALLDAVVVSPVRRTVKPAGLPDPAGETSMAAARRAAGQVPEVARLLGLPIPPPPGPRRPTPTGARSG